jgi:hypothetical protein
MKDDCGDVCWTINLAGGVMSGHSSPNGAPGGIVTVEKRQ